MNTTNEPWLVWRRGAPGDVRMVMVSVVGDEAERARRAAVDALHGELPHARPDDPWVQGAIGLELIASRRGPTGHRQAWAVEVELEHVRRAVIREDVPSTSTTEGDGSRCMPRCAACGGLLLRVRASSGWLDVCPGCPGGEAA